MLELLAQEGVDLQTASAVPLSDVVLVPSELRKVLHCATDVPQALCAGLRMLVDALHCAHSQLAHQSA
jgi:hypothetical protein